jgi:hypothetical protein
VAAAQGVGPVVVVPGSAVSQIGANPSGARSALQIGAVGAAQPPCDALSGGCLSAFSVVQRMSSAYKGPLFLAYRSDGQTFSISTRGATGIVDIPTLHADCDGYDCFVETLYDQGTAGNTMSNLDPNSMLALGWDRNGAPTIVIKNGRGSSTSHNFSDYTAGHMWLYPTNGLPTTGSRTLYASTDNYNWSSVVEFFGWAGDNAAKSDAFGSGWTMAIMQQDPNTPTNAILGNDFENFAYNLGVYPGGYGKVSALLKYDATKNLSTGEALPSVGCQYNNLATCQIYTAFAQTPGYTINTGNGLPSPTLRIGTGTDNVGGGGRFQSGIIANYATTNAEDSAVLRAMSVVTFAPPVSPCSASASVLSSGAPNTLIASPTSYPAIPTLNETNLVFAYSTVLWNPNYTGALFRVKRADNGATTDIYPAGCEADAQAIALAGAGTTLTVPEWFDQSGHGWTAQAASPLTTATLSATGMNGKPCLVFTAPTLANSTGTVGATFTGNSSGTNQLTASSVTGVIEIGATLPGITPTSFYPNFVTIVSQVSGTTGGAGVYTTSAPTTLSNVANLNAMTNIAEVTAMISGTLAVGQVTNNPRPGAYIVSQISGTSGGVGRYLLSAGGVNTGGVFVGVPYTQYVLDNSMWAQPAGGSGYILYKNQTIESVFSASAAGASTIVGAYGSWTFGSNASGYTLSYGYNGGYALNETGTFSSNAPHFGYLTADGSTPQNLAISQDGSAAVTGTTTAYTQLGSNPAGNYIIGAENYYRGFNGCLSMVALYNDVESSGNLTAAHTRAQAEWSVP